MKRRIALTLFLCLFVSLTASEFINSLFNVRFDQQGADFKARILFSLKPTVMAIFVVFTSMLNALVFKYLKPLFDFYRRDYKSKEQKAAAYGKARKAAIGMPRIIILFQISVWVIGTTAYYALKHWQAESGIPFLFGLLLKVASGILGSLYVVFLINLELMPFKKGLYITDVRKGERDQFARVKDYLAILGSTFYLLIQLSYIAWYYAQSQVFPEPGSFIRSLLPVGVFLFIATSGPVFLSKREYRIQISELLHEMNQLHLQEGSRNLNPVYISNFDELGDLAASANRVVATFTVVLEKVRSAVTRLAQAAQSLQTDSHSNADSTTDQAASVAEVVATMEDADRLSRKIAELAEEVEKWSDENKEKVNSGIQGLDQYIQRMNQLKEANQRSINFQVSLSEHIQTIMDVSNIIKSIADQVKIIAFNAELEAAAAGDAGKNFEIVASEVRRLADNTSSAAREIREKIHTIEQESTHLQDASRETTELIDASWESSRETSTSFSAIEQTSLETSSSAKRIAENIRMQIQGFEQILETMKGISHQAQEVSTRTHRTAETALGLESLIMSLKDLAQEESS